MNNILALLSIFVVFAISWSDIAQSAQVSCSIYEQRYKVAEKTFEAKKEVFKLHFMQKKIAFSKTSSGKLQLKLKNPAVKALAGSAIVMATHEALLQKCHEQEGTQATGPSMSIDTPSSFTLEEQNPK